MNNSKQDDWYLTSPDISLQKDQVSINSKKNFIRACSNIYKGKKWEFVTKLKWVSGDSCNAGVYFGYWHLHSTFFLELNSNNKIYLKRIFKNDNNEYNNFLIKDFKLDKGRLYNIYIKRNNNNYLIEIDGETIFDFTETSDYNPGLKDLESSPFVNGRHPNFNGGFALGFYYNSAYWINQDKQVGVIFKDTKITGESYDGIKTECFSKDFSLRNQDVRLTFWFEKKDRDYYADIDNFMNKLEQVFLNIEELTDVAFDFSYKEPEIFTGLAGSAYNTWQAVYMLKVTPDIDYTTIHEIAHWIHVFYGEDSNWTNHAYVDFITDMTYKKLHGINYQPILFANADGWVGKPESYDMPFLNLRYYDKKHDILDKKAFYLNYTKSNLLFFSLYQQIGMKNIQKVCSYINSSKHAISADDYIDIFEKVSGKDLSHMKNGWILDKPYTKGWSINDFFKDQDGDNLRDIEEMAYGTDINNDDTDNDGYSDWWEILNGYDPANKNSPGKINRIAIDGIIDDFYKIAGDKAAAVVDYEADNVSKSGVDLKSLSSFCDDKYLYVCASFYNSPEVYDKVHDIVVNDNFIIAFTNNRFWNITRKINDEWKYSPRSNEDRNNIKGIITKTGAEWRIPLSYLDKTQTFLVQYKPYDRDKNNKSVVNDILKMRIKTNRFNDNNVLIDGNAKDLLQKGEQVISKSDKQKDGISQNYLDIKKLNAYIKEDFLYISSDYFAQPEKIDKAYYTLNLWTYGEKKHNFWIQGDMFNSWVYIKKSMEDSKDSTIIKYSDTAYQMMHYKQTEWKLPLTMFDDPYKISVELFSGYEKDWNADKSGIIILKTDKKAENDIFIDGDLKDLVKEKGIYVCNDTPGDKTVKDGFDIKAIYGIIKGDYLYLGAEYEEVPLNPEGINHIFYLTGYGDKKIHYNIQTSTDRSWLVIQRKEAGQNEWKNVVKTDLKYEVEFGTHSEWKLPLILFENADRLVINYVAGGKDKWDADYTMPLIIKTSSYPKNKVFIDGDLTDYKSNRKDIVIKDDPSGDYKDNGCYDIKSISGYIDQDYLYLGADFYNIPDSKEFLVHHFYIEAWGKDKIAFYFQGYANSSWHKIKKNISGQKDWKDLKLINSPDYQTAISNASEWRIPMELFKGYKKLLIKYISGSAKNWDADTCYFLMKTDEHPQDQPFIDGDISDLKKLYNERLAVFTDEDTPGKGYDIKNVYAVIKNGFLYAGADFFEKPQDNKSYFHTLCIRDKKTKMNWWIQGSEEVVWGVREFVDGTHYSKWKGIGTPSGVEAFIDINAEWKIPMSIFGNNPDLQLYYISGGSLENGEQKWDFDYSEWLDVSAF